MNTVDIPNLDVKIWIRKSEFPQGNLLCSLAQPEMMRQRTLEITDIEYDLIKDKISRIKRVE